jgi:AAA+ superfamily predicted ATPase
VAVIEKSVCQAVLVGAENEEFAPAVERVLRAHVTLNNNGRKPRHKLEACEEYTLDGVCMEGSPRDLLKTCHCMDEALRKDDHLPPRAGNMLFYGPPGTGKTALAHYIAKQLDRECIVKKASDLISKWVGETEQQIAEAFRRAEADGAVLVVDEADSFIYSRDMAQRSWETTQVNEFLTALEECRGFCICTTNRRDNLDAAAMRRFSHKVPFTYAGEEQLTALYASLLAPLVNKPLTREGELLLRGMKRLTPGDFYAVKAQYWLNKQGTVETCELLERLRHEQYVKLDSRNGKMGF